MPRRGDISPRPLEPDKVYNSRLVQQVINKVMVDGKKSTAEQIVYDSLDILSRRTNNEPVPALEESIKILTPTLEVRSRRWREKSMSERLAGELGDAQSQQGAAYKRKDDIFRMAQANKAFAHYRW